MAQPSMMLEPVAIDEPTGVLAEPWSIGKAWRLARMFGPAAILASVSIGAGETIVVVQAGSWAGYDLLWLVMLSVLVKGICVTYLLGRYTAVSGEPIGQRLVSLPGPRGWLLLLIAFLELAAAGPLWTAVARPCGDLIHHLIERAVLAAGGPSAGTASLDELGGLSATTCKALLTTGFIALALVLGMGLSFASLERQQVVICGVLVCGTIIGTLMVRPDLAAALAGCVRIGHLPNPPPWAPEVVGRQPLLTLTTTFGYVGGSVMTYIAYANWVSIHRWGLCGHPRIDQIRGQAAAGSPGDYLPDDAVQASRLRRLAAPLRWDVGIGAVVLAVVTGSFMLAGAAVLYPRLASGQSISAFSEWSLLTDQGHIWQNIHPTLIWVYYVCVLAALWGTLQSYPEIYCRVTHQFWAAIWPRHTVSYRRLQIAICAYVFVASVPLVWSDIEFSTTTAIVAFLATNAGVAVAMLAALYLNFQLPPRYRTRWWMLVAGVASAVILVAVSAISGWELLRSIGAP
jgi:Mn2+/Fe2+ NRAMP family transporter